MTSTRKSPHRRLVPVNPDLALEAQSLRPTSAFSRITAEALADWISKEKRRVAILAEAEKKAVSD